MSLSFIVLNIVHICSFSVFIDIVLCVFHLSKNSKYIFAYLISSCVYLSPSKNSFPYHYKEGFSVEFIGISHGSRLISIYLFYMQNDSGIHFIQLLRKEMDVNEHVTLRYTLKKRSSACIAVLHVTVTIGPSKLKSN